jgi:hypothetical protein
MLLPLVIFEREYSRAMTSQMIAAALATLLAIGDVNWITRRSVPGKGSDDGDMTTCTSVDSANVRILLPKCRISLSIHFEIKEHHITSFSNNEASNII